MKLSELKKAVKQLRKKGFEIAYYKKGIFGVYKGDGAVVEMSAQRAMGRPPVCTKGQRKSLLVR